MATKGYTVMRYSGPWPQDENEAWNKAAWKISDDLRSAATAAGATGFRVTSDVFGNTPVTMYVTEFATVEQALAWTVSPVALEAGEKFKKLGTLDFSITVHRLVREE